jgi:hypothetical protein
MQCIDACGEWAAVLRQRNYGLVTQKSLDKYPLKMACVFYSLPGQDDDMGAWWEEMIDQKQDDDMGAWCEEMIDQMRFMRNEMQEFELIKTMHELEGQILFFEGRYSGI